MPLISIERHGLEGLKSERHNAPELLPFLWEYFGGKWPANAKLYHSCISSETEVTPQPGSVEDIERLKALPGPFHVLVLPAAELTVFQVLQIFLVVASVITAVAFKPDIPVAATRNIQSESPNNGLSDRTNQARLNGRIPDIYGTVRSTPDLIQVPYKVFQDHVEKENAFMCIGRGYYDIPRRQVRDDTTPAEEISGMSVEVYAPFTSPNSGHTPQLSIGGAINTPVLRTQRMQSVNGQSLLPSDTGGSYRNAVRFESPNIIHSEDDTVDFSAMFNPGDPITITRAQQTEGSVTYVPTTDFELKFTLPPSFSNGHVDVPGDITPDFGATTILIINDAPVRWLYVTEDGSLPIWGNLAGAYRVLSCTYDAIEDKTTFVLEDVRDENGAWNNCLIAIDGLGEGSPTLSRPSDVVLFDLSGTYTINTVVSDTITLDNPSAVNTDWDVMEDDYGGETDVLFPDLFTSGERWIGEFTLESDAPITRLISNFVALQGLFADNGSNQYSQSVNVRLEATPVDAAGDPIGTTEVFTGTVVGSNTTRSTRALTMYADLSATSARWKVRARRTSPKNTSFNGTVVDEIKWRDLYGASEIDVTDFGNVTTVQTVTLATDGALAIKDRKLNMLVTRKLPARTSEGWTTELYPTNNVADIFCAVALDPFIGNRQESEIDVENIYATSDAIASYFGFEEARHFNYTFDKSEVSPEETLHMIADAVFCTAYRRGSVLRLFFERESADSALLFNHRNKLPGSERRTVTFGPQQSWDGIEYQYVSPIDDALVTLYLPEDRTAVNARKIESVGVRDDRQAHIHAWREFQKILYQNTSVEFDALPVADLLVLSERILVADNTRTGSMDGEILDVDGLEVRLSQPIPWDEDETYTVFLQSSDGLVESMPVTMGQSARHAVLDRAPRTPIVYEADRYARTTFVIVRDGDERNATPFLLTEKDPQEDGSSTTVTAINYDARYYEHDHDFA